MSSMRFTAGIVAAVALAAATVPVRAQDEVARLVADGGIKAKGWQGVVDASEASRGAKLENARLAEESGTLHVVTGPAVTYWNPANQASGNYTVSATFTEPSYMNLNDHPHPYGIMIGGNALGSPQQSLLYCAAYGNGSFIVRGFGPEPFKVNGARGEANPAVHKAAGKGAPVTQEIAVSVKGDKVECAINGTIVGSYDKAAVVGEGKLKSTDGVYGIRLAHNAEVKVTGLKVTKQ